MAEMEQPVDGPFGAAPSVRLPLEAAGKQELSPAEPAGPAPVPAAPRVFPTNEDGFGGGLESFPLAGFPEIPRWPNRSKTVDRGNAEATQRAGD